MRGLRAWAPRWLACYLARRAWKRRARAKAALWAGFYYGSSNPAAKRARQLLEDVGTRHGRASWGAR